MVLKLWSPVRVFKVLWPRSAGPGKDACYDDRRLPPSLAMALPDPPPEAPTPRDKGSFLQVLGAVLWGFFGIRKRSAMSRDVATIKPQHVIVVGVILAAIFVLTLLTVVRLVTRGL
jgi:hypothetical protein